MQTNQNKTQYVDQYSEILKSLQSDFSLKPYWCEITISTGQYEKGETLIVNANTESAANDIACLNSCHCPNDAEWTKDGVLDAYGEFLCHSYARLIPQTHAEFLIKNGYASAAEVNFFKLYRLEGYAELTPFSEYMVAILSSLNKYFDGFELVMANTLCDAICNAYIEEIDFEETVFGIANELSIDRNTLAIDDELDNS